MKFSRYKGFTLVELMIVIAVIGILFVAMQQFNANPSIYQEKINRLAEQLHDDIRDTKHNLLIGKKGNSGISESGKITFYSNDPSNGADKNRYSVVVGGRSKNRFIMIDGDENYKLEKIEINSGGAWQPVSKLELAFKRNISGTGTGTSVGGANADFSDYRITVDYQGFKRYVEGNVVTGNSEVKTKL